MMGVWQLTELFGHMTNIVPVMQKDKMGLRYVRIVIYHALKVEMNLPLKAGTK